MDKIHIKKLAFFAYHGVYDAEKHLGQKFFISLSLTLDLKEAGLEDDLEKSVCYKSVVETVLNFSTENRFQTIEALAEHLADYLLKTFKKVTSIHILLEKPSAAIAAIFETIAIEIERHRK